jgi:hypothetical protein
MLLLLLAAEGGTAQTMEVATATVASVEKNGLDTEKVAMVAEKSMAAAEMADYVDEIKDSRGGVECCTLGVEGKTVLTAQGLVRSVAFNSNTLE